MTTWIILRAAGIAAYLMLFASVAWGLVATTSALGRRVSKATAVAIHQFVSTVALVFLGIHLGGLLLDRFLPFRPLDILVPLHSTFRPWAVASGIIAMYAMVVVLVSSWTRKRIGTKWWRRLHVLVAPAFTMSMIHGVMSGTDTVRPWMWLTYLATGLVVVFLMVVRGLTVGLRAVRAARPEKSPADLPAREAGASPPAHRPREARPGRPAPGAALRTGEFRPGSGEPEAPPAIVIKLEVHLQVGEDGEPKVVEVNPVATRLSSKNGHNGQP